jgi:hypothetical protein
VSILTNFNTRIVTAIATAAVILGAVAPAAFADTTITVTGNGAGSNNTVVTNNSTNTSVNQSNNSTVVTSVNSTASTGGNDSSFNTGGETSIQTGNATSKVKVTVGGSSNAAVITDPCGCNTTTNVDVSGNGAESSNGVILSSSSWFNAIQNNWTSIITEISSVGKTGKNTSSFNTGGTTTTTTGNSTSKVKVNVTGSNNTLVH